MLGGRWENLPVSLHHSYAISGDQLYTFMSEGLGEGVQRFTTKNKLKGRGNKKRQANLGNKDCNCPCLMRVIEILFRKKEAYVSYRQQRSRKSLEE